MKVDDLHLDESEKGERSVENPKQVSGFNKKKISNPRRCSYLPPSLGIEEHRRLILKTTY